MHQHAISEHTRLLQRAIQEDGFVRAKNETIIRRGGERNNGGWLFDIRGIALRGDCMDHINRIFWDTFRDQYPFQIGGLETAGIPLVASIVMHGFIEEKRADSSGFFIRKSRKKDGLMRIVEGTIVPDRPIILVDDLINSGKSFMRQVEVLEGLGHTVHTVWTVLRFRDEEYYEYFRKKGIAVKNIFTLDDFSEMLGVKNLKEKDARPKLRQCFDAVWKFASPDPSYHYVVPKSDPALDAERVYFGSDSGIFWALNQGDGSVAWSLKTGWHPKGKGIFSSPAVHDGTVYFGGYDGNVYGLDARSGKKKWISFEADWVGSSPALAPDIGLVFIGLEYGLFRKRGGIAALDMQTGKTVWAYRDMPCFTHSSPLYIESKKQVVVGSNDGAAYLFDAKKGALLWKFETGALNEHERDTGFSRFDIKESFAYDEKRDLVVFANRDGGVFFVDGNTGMEKGRFTAEFGFYSTPVIYRNTALVSSLDKNLYCIDLDTFKEKWRWNAGARIFATPVVIEGSVYIGANSGRLTELDPETGAERSFVTLAERITNRVAYNSATKHFFVPTFANEIYCMKKKRDPAIA